MDGFKRSDEVGTSICCGYADDMVQNITLDVLSYITFGGWNFRGDDHILLYLNFSSIVFIIEGHCKEHVI